MDAADHDSFYESLPTFRDFAGVMEPSRFKPLPAGWVVGVSM